MSTFKRLGMVGTALAMFVLSGCIVAPRDHGPYRYENGDRIDRDGHHEAHWCEHNRGDEHCR